MTAADNLSGWLLGLPRTTSIDRIHWFFAAPWASEGFGPVWLGLGIVGLFGLCAMYYLVLQSSGRFTARFALAAVRGMLLSLLLLSLAEPALRIDSTARQAPRVYVLFDGTESMAIEDAWTAARREALMSAVGSPAVNSEQPLGSRISYVRAWLRASPERQPLAQLERAPSYRLEPFLFDGQTTSRLRRLDEFRSPAGHVNWSRVSEQLTTSGQVTAIGNVLADIERQAGAGDLAAVILISDFAHNSGPLPQGPEQSVRAAAGPDVPVFTIGVGAVEVIDLAVDLRTDLKIRQGEPTSIRVDLRQQGLTGREVTLRVTARPELSRGLEPGSQISADSTEVGRRTLTLGDDSQVAEFSFTPAASGRYRLEVEADVLDGEVVRTNNIARREVQVIDDYVRLMYVAHEPGWEWRFIKEVFHRDETVGMQGFRTYLASSDPRVRQSNPLFLPTLTPSRPEFFANDVIFLDDMPHSALSPLFGEMVREFVGRLGGGLVVIAGPRFGPGQLAGTPLADMLPVVVDPDLSFRDAQPFSLRRTPRAAGYRFMQLDDSPEANRRAWNNLGPLPWYQPVAQVHERADVLAEHPADTCRDGRTPQPLIAVRRFGEGEVVYLGFNEFWRLRRKHGERYYRRFWSPLIDRLGLSHALGNKKRFVPRLDRDTYRVEEHVVLTVQVFDRDYAPLPADQVESGSLPGELWTPDAEGRPTRRRSLAVPFIRDGLCELRIPVYTPGTYRLRVHDPLSEDFVDREFEVRDLSAERRGGVRDLELQQRLAEWRNGRSYELTTARRLVDDLDLPETEVRETRTLPLWTTPAWLVLLLTLLLGEWTVRKVMRLI